MENLCYIFDLEKDSWLKPGRFRHTDSIDKAGIYPQAEAEQLVNDANDDHDGMRLISIEIDNERKKKEYLKRIVKKSDSQKLG